MLSYQPLRSTLRARNKKRTDLTNVLSSGTIAKLAKNKSVSLSTIDTICQYLDCKIEDVVIYVKNDE